MSDAATLLDTPKKLSLDSQAKYLRAALKDFERTFALDHDGRKPSKEDIKVDVAVAAKYKEYNRVRDVLAGKLSYDAFMAPPPSPARETQDKRRRRDSGISLTPRQSTNEISRPKNLHPSQLDPYDSPPSASPKPVFLQAIGPTPQRDGRVLGLFDMLSNSGRSSQATPSTRKRKVDVSVAESPGKIAKLHFVQTPGRVRNKGGDLLDHLAGSPGLTPQTGRRRGSKTPISEGRKFLLSQFFATPSAVRYGALQEETDIDHETSLRNAVLGMTPQRPPQEHAMDATPVYLKRSTSFKDRLLSASQTTSAVHTRPTSPDTTRTAPHTWRRFKSAVKPLSQIVANLRAIEDEQHEDDLEAMREMEDSQTFSPIEANSHTPDRSPQRLWKKKGQKRTTRKVKIRPTRAIVVATPQLIAEDDEDASNVVVDSAEQASELNEDDFDTTDAERDWDDKITSGHNSRSESGPASDKQGRKAKAGSNGSSEDKENYKGKSAGKINPNAQSHMNFRSLKIRNKNSKAKGAAGRGRFGRKR